MPKIVFKNEETAKLFDTNSEVDVLLEVGCECNGGQGFKGFLSDIPPMAAMELVNQNYLVKPKPALKQAKEATSPK